MTPTPQCDADGTQSVGARGLRTYGHDRPGFGITEQAIRCRWPISPEQRQKCVDIATEIANDPKSTRRAKTAALRVLAQFDSITQRDVAHVEKMDQEMGIMKIRQDRAEQGLPNDSIAIQVLPPPTVMPAPAWMNRMGLLDPNQG